MSEAIHRVEVAVPAGAELGEAPTWDIRTGVLLWVDILGSRVHRFDPTSSTTETTQLKQHVSAAKPRSRGGLVLNLRDGIALADPSGSLTWLVYWARDGVRGNDAAVDPSGRLWAGTMRYDTTEGGWLTRISGDGSVRTVLTDARISNGIAWSPERTAMYYIDSAYPRIDVFDYDDPSGEARDRRPFIEVTDTDGVPDGLCVDAEGCLWVAVNGGGVIRRYTPAGALDREVPVPVSQPTSCCFGGWSFTDLYITTAREHLSPERLREQPHAGDLLVVPDLGQGCPTPVFTG